MAYTLLKAPDQWLIQVQKNGKRKTKRLKGTETNAENKDKELWAELENEIKFEEARALVGLSRKRQVARRERITEITRLLR